MMAGVVSQNCDSFDRPLTASYLTLRLFTIMSVLNSYQGLNSMRTTASALMLLLLLGLAAPSQQTVAFCDLVRHSDQYNGKEVKVRATLRYTFETQQFYCLSCQDAGTVTLELVNDLDSDKSSDLQRIEKATKGTGLVNLTVRGRFSTGNGHMFKIVAYEIKDIAVIAKGGRNYEKAEKESGCGGAHPK